MKMDEYDYNQLASSAVRQNAYRVDRQMSKKVSNGDFGILDIDSILYPFKITFISELCFRIKFIESIPPLKGIFDNQIWITKYKFDNMFNIIEILTKEHVRDLKIESINE